MLIISIALLLVGFGALLLILGLRTPTTQVIVFGLFILAFQLIGQIVRVKLDDPRSCLQVFRTNRDAGLILAVSLAAGAMLERGVMDQFSF